MEALVLASFSGLALRCVGFQRWHAILAWYAARGRGAGRTSASAAQRAALVRSAIRWAPASPTCLHRSLTLWCLLRRAGIDSDLRIGVRSHAGRFEAHAWVEHQGKILNDEDVNRSFTPFDRAIQPIGA